MRSREFIIENITSKQVLGYVKNIHPDWSSNVDHMILNHKQWQLINKPIKELQISDPESEDAYIEDPYNRILDIDMSYVGDISKQEILNRPIVADTDGYIIDGNHRALAARLIGLSHIPAYVPVETLDEDSTSISIELVTPQELNVNLKQQVIDLVAQGGEVASNFISTGINRAKLLGIAVDQDRVVAVTAVKQPLTEYRNKVFAAAGVADLADQYPYESGYSYTDSEYRTSGVSARLHREVFRRVNQPMFATVRSDNRVALLGLQRLGFAAIGQPYASSRGDYTLTLLVTS